MEPPYSFKKFNYFLRPSKQVERKIFIEAMLRLQEYDYPIPRYTYVGLGSVYYADFILFHKYLYIEKMICAEWTDVPKRMKFNRPYSFIKVRMMPVLHVFPELKRNTKYLVWLDYDEPLDGDKLQDTDGCIQRIAPGSVFLITIDARSKLRGDKMELRKLTFRQHQSRLVHQFREDFGRVVDRAITKSDLGSLATRRLYYEAINSQIELSMATREPLVYCQLFNIFYADNAAMMTVGGIIDTPERIQQLRESDFVGYRFISLGSNELEISVPPLTGREKQWLDSNIRDSLTVDKLKFELDEEMFDNYVKYYREYPTYVETLT